MSNEDQGVAFAPAASAAYDGPAGSLLRIAESLESEAKTASRSGQAWSLNQLAQELRGALGDVTAALRRLQSDLAAREENLKVEAASWKDITDALSQQAAEAKQKARVCQYSYPSSGEYGVQYGTVLRCDEPTNGLLFNWPVGAEDAVQVGVCAMHADMLGKSLPPTSEASPQ